MPRRNVWRVYLKPFDDDGNYSDWVEVTRDVAFDQMGALSESLDNSEYDIGIFKPAQFALALRNESGKYSDVDNVKSIFKYLRTNTQVKVTYDNNPDGGPYGGLLELGDTWMGEEIEVFKGLVNDDATTQDIDTNLIRFTVIGRETIFNRVIVPDTGISNGDLFSAVLLAILDQPEITVLMTVDADNITPDLDQTIDDASTLAGKTVLEALKLLLLATNSVFYIRDDVIYIASRDPSAETLGFFYGQGSSGGPENIQTIKGVTSANGKIFNYLTWASTTTVIDDGTSITRYGAHKKELDIDFMTDTTRRQNTLQAIVDEFKNPKQEFDLYSPINFTTLGLRLLDRCSIDYPTVYIQDESYPPAICGVAVCGHWYTPSALWDFQVDSEDSYKILQKSIDVKSALVKFRMRKV